MTISRIATTRKTTKNYAMLIEGGKGVYTLTAADLLTHDTATKAQAELERQTSLAKEALPPLFIHKNRNGSFALATGAAPEVWGEDLSLPKDDVPPAEAMADMNVGDDPVGRR